MNPWIKNGDRDWKLRDFAKRFENTRSWFAFLGVGSSSEVLPVGYLKGRYQFEPSLMPFEADLHGWLCRMARPMGTLMAQWVLSSDFTVSPSSETAGSSKVYTLLGGFLWSSIVQLIEHRPRCWAKREYRLMWTTELSLIAVLSYILNQDAFLALLLLRLQ